MKQQAKTSMNMDEYKVEQRQERKKEKEFRKMRKQRKWQWSE